MGFSAQWNKAYSGFSKALLDCGKQLTKQGEVVMLNAAEKWLRDTDAEWPKGTPPDSPGDHDHPWYTGTLHDSIAVRVADGKRTIGIRYMPPAAVAPQTATEAQTGIRDYDNIVGTVYGRITAARGSRVKQNGTVAQMFIGVPYAQSVNEYWRYEGFIENLNEYFIAAMEDAFSPHGNEFFRNIIVKPRES